MAIGIGTGLSPSLGDGIVVGDALEAGYYISQSQGDDANDGLTPSTAWKTLSKVNGYGGFISGDILHFKGDDIWNETLTLTDSGLILTDYATVTLKPIIHGQDTRLYNIDVQGCTNLLIKNIICQDPTSAGIIYDSGPHEVRNVISDGSGDQAFQHLQNTVVTYYDSVASNAVDDGFSVHGNSVIVVNDSTIHNCDQGVQDAGATPAFITFNRCVFDNNTLDITTSALITVEANWCLFKSMAGALRKSVNAAKATLHYCIINLVDSVQTNTQITPGVGAGNLLSLKNCTIYGWSGSTNRGGVTAAANSTIVLDNCIADRLWRLGYIASGAAINADYCNIYNKTTGTLTTNTNPIAGNPLLVYSSGGDPEAGDFALGTGSPCINAGKDYSGRKSVDYLGNPTHPTTPSLGAIEHS